VSKSAYESPYDSVHDLNAKIIGIQFNFVLITKVCLHISTSKIQKLTCRNTFGSISYTESYDDSYAKSHV
jgi:hypothetical protein